MPTYSDVTVPHADNLTQLEQAQFENALANLALIQAGITLIQERSTNLQLQFHIAQGNEAKANERLSATVADLLKAHPDLTFNSQSRQFEKKQT